MKFRADVILSRLKLARSRSHAQDLIQKGLVFFDGKPVAKPSFEIDEVESAKIQINDHELLRYVSRGGVKLKGALEIANLSVKDFVCLDVGQSTGGFTQCLIERGAKKVIGIEVGREQISDHLKEHSQVRVYESINIKETPESKLLGFNDGKRYDLVVVDVSFISLEHVIPRVASAISEGGHLLALVKPQFEVGKNNITKSGIVIDPRLYGQVQLKIEDQVLNHGLIKINYFESPIEGKDGNKEFFIHARPNSTCRLPNS